MDGTIPALPVTKSASYLARMFIVSEADAAAIRAAYNEQGKLSAALELRRRFPGVTDNEKARAHVRTIAGWQPLPDLPATVVPLQPRKRARPAQPLENT